MAELLSLCYYFFFFSFSSLFLLLSSSLSSQVSISVSPATLTRSNRTIQVQWRGIDSPSELDWLGIYSPPESRDDHFIGYVFLSSSPGWRSGAGSVSIPLVNLRSGYDFRVFRWTADEIDPRRRDHDNNTLPGTRHRLAASPAAVWFDRPAGPEQVHLSFTDLPDEMRVVFVTGDGSLCAVRYGDAPERLDRVAGASAATTYRRTDMCDKPANSSLGWRDPGFIHDAVMTGLENGKRYYYQVGSDAKGWTDIYSFISRSDYSSEITAFMFGDMGTYAPYSTFYRMQEESKSTGKWILRDMEALGDKPAFVSHIGDISYARGFSWVWDEFFNQIEPIASRIPYHVCIGNHEYDWPTQPWRPSWAWGVYGKDGGGECGVPYSLKFKMPGSSSLPTGTGAPDTRNLYYSFDAGSVHFMYISTETDFLKGSNQYNFIEADLKSVNRSKTPFVVVQGHRPMYTTSNEVRDAPMRERMLDNLEPLLVAYNVTLALWGHVHRYERFCPMRNYTCEDAEDAAGRFPVHVVIGMAGQDWQASWEPRPDHQAVPIFPQPGRSMYRGGEFGYTRLVADREKLTLTYIGNHDGEVHDFVEIRSAYFPKDKLDNVIERNESQVVDKTTTTTTTEAAANEPSQQPQLHSKPGSYFLEVAGILLVGAIVGYGLGFVTRCRRDANPKGNAWSPVRTDDN